MRNVLKKQTLNLTTINISPNGNVDLQNIESFNAKSNPFENMRIKSLNIRDSNILFVNDEYEYAKCDHYAEYERSIFSSFSVISISSSNYDNVICPFIFSNFNLEELIISNIDKKFEFKQMSLYTSYYVQSQTKIKSFKIN